MYNHVCHCTMFYFIAILNIRRTKEHAMVRKRSVTGWFSGCRRTWTPHSIETHRRCRLLRASLAITNDVKNKKHRKILVVWWNRRFGNGNFDGSSAFHSNWDVIDDPLPMFFSNNWRWSLSRASRGERGILLNWQLFPTCHIALTWELLWWE